MYLHQFFHFYIVQVLVQKLSNELSRDVKHILRDYANQFYVSSVVVRELIHVLKMIRRVFVFREND